MFAARCQRCQGLPGALGVKLAHPDRPVVVLSGDGSAMYSPQALWTAAHERLPVVFGVFVNREYLILKNYLRGMKGDSVHHDRYVDLGQIIDYYGDDRCLRGSGDVGDIEVNGVVGTVVDLIDRVTE